MAYQAHLGTTDHEWTHIGEMNGPAIMYGAALNCLDMEFPLETDPLRLWLELHELAPAYRFTRPEKFLKESNVNIIHQDEFGILYHKHFHDGSWQAMVCVKNSTPEPDGSRKEYYLRVPPDIHTARGAVAWTFGLQADEYEPEFES